MINFENVVKTYNGRVGCMCGCNGKYTIPSHTSIAHANEQLGYEGYNESNVSDRSVKIAIRKINNALAMSEQEREGEGIQAGIQDGFDDVKIAFFQSNCRSTVIYFK